MAFQITVKIGLVKAVIDVLASTTVGRMKLLIEKEMNMKQESYYLIYVDGKKKHKLEDQYTMEDYGIAEDKEFQFAPKLSGTGKRARAVPGAPAGEGDRVEKDAKIRALRAEILTNMVMTQGTRNIVSHNVRTRIMELERDFQQRKADEIFQHLYTNMTEQQMLALQEKYVGAGRNMNLRYAAVSKSIFEQQFQQIEDCRIELTNMAKMLNDTSNLAMYLQYCGNDGFLNWADFAKTLNKTVTEKSRAVGAVVGAAAAGANNLGFRTEEL